MSASSPTAAAADGATAGLAAVASDPGGVTVHWRDGFSSAFHPLWLRDNCRCAECGDPGVGRRRLRLTDLDPAVSAADVGVADGAVQVHWSDGHRGCFAGDWLRAHAYDDDSRRARAAPTATWTPGGGWRPPELDFAAVMAGERGLHGLLAALARDGLAFLAGAPAEPGVAERLATRIGPVRESNFGRIQDIVIDPQRRSIANSTAALKPHTDEPYRASPPGIILFHCVETDITGAGESVFLDGFAAAETVRREDPEGFAALCRHRQAWRRHFAGDVDLSAEFPVIAVDEFGAVTGVRVNDRVAAPLSIPPGAVATYYRGLRRLLALCEDPERMLHRRLRPGDIAVFDNHRILHGRTALTLATRRRLQWASVARGDCHSTARILAARLGLAPAPGRGRGAY